MTFAQTLRDAPLTAKIGLGIIALNAIAVVFAPWIASYGETQVVGDQWLPGFWDRSAAPAGLHVWLGTDQLGRDLFSRLIYGARNSILIALATTSLSFTLGVTTGMVAATARGRVDQFMSWVVDIVMGFPTLIFALLLLAVLGSSVPVLIGVIALLDATRVFRLSRALGMELEAQDYVELAKLRGEQTLWIVFHEILPNAIGPLAAEFGLRFCFVFLFIATLSFLGLGIQPPTADWGSMVRENASAISFGILIPLFPAAAIAILTVSVNLVVDWFIHLTGDARHGR
ncbi:MAG: ABC transporter permease [Pseudomonadota bacterium]|nr:ABC transporter permease [Pseudomonadota bacterium]